MLCTSLPQEDKLDAALRQTAAAHGVLQDEFDEFLRIAGADDTQQEIRRKRSNTFSHHLFQVHSGLEKMITGRSGSIVAAEIITADSLILIISAVVSVKDGDHIVVSVKDRDQIINEIKA